MLLQLPLFMQLDQEAFTILRQSVHSTREPVSLQPEQVGFCPQVLKVFTRVFVVLAKRIRESITVMSNVFEPFTGLAQFTTSDGLCTIECAFSVPIIRMPILFVRKHSTEQVNQPACITW